MLSFEQLADKYLKFAYAVANRSCRTFPAHEREDAISDGMLGFVSALKRIDPDREEHEITGLLGRRISGAVIDGLRARTHMHRPSRTFAHTVSLDAPISGDEFDDPIALGDCFGAEDRFMLQRESRIALSQMMDLMDARLRYVTQRIFFDEVTYCEIAEELGVTESRVGQMRKLAVAQLKCIAAERSYLQARRQKEAV